MFDDPDLNHQRFRIKYKKIKEKYPEIDIFYLNFFIQDFV